MPRTRRPATGAHRRIGDLAKRSPRGRIAKPGVEALEARLLLSSDPPMLPAPPPPPSPLDFSEYLQFRHDPLPQGPIDPRMTDEGVRTALESKFAAYVESRISGQLIAPDAQAATVVSWGTLGLRSPSPPRDGGTFGPAMAVRLADITSVATSDQSGGTSLASAIDSHKLIQALAVGLSAVSKQTTCDQSAATATDPGALGHALGDRLGNVSPVANCDQTVVPAIAASYLEHALADRLGDLSLAERGSSTPEPGLGNVTLRGTLTPSASEVVMKFAFGPSTGSIEFVLRPVGRTLDLTAFDSGGRTLATATFAPGGEGFAMSLPRSEMVAHGGPDSSIYVRIMESDPTVVATSTVTGTAADTSAVRPDATSFVLYVARHNVASSATDSEAEGSSAIWVGTPNGSRPISYTSVSPPPEISASEIGATGLKDDEVDTVPVPVATGPLPSRSASALGGVLASGESVTVVDTHDAALIDLALIDLVPGIEAVDGVPVAVEARPVQVDSGDGAFAVVSGPGGFPLLALSTNGSFSRASSVALPAFTSPAVPTTSAEAEAIGLAGSELPEPVLTLEADRRSGKTREASVLAGMSVAVAVAVGLALPDVSDPRRTGTNARSRLRRWFSKRRPTPRSV